jgi:hypothetical protein
LDLRKIDSKKSNGMNSFESSKSRISRFCIKTALATESSVAFTNLCDALPNERSLGD